MFCICSPIFLNKNFQDVVCLVNNNYIFTLNYVNVEDLYFLVLLGRYSKKECQISVLIFQGKYHYLFP